MAVMDSHGHDHRHTHIPKNFGPMFAIATALNVALVAVQVFYGIDGSRTPMAGPMLS